MTCISLLDQIPCISWSYCWHYAQAQWIVSHLQLFDGNLCMEIVKVWGRVRAQHLYKSLHETGLEYPMCAIRALDVAQQLDVAQLFCQYSRWNVDTTSTQSGKGKQNLKLLHGGAAFLVYLLTLMETLTPPTHVPCQSIMSQCKKLLTRGYCHWALSNPSSKEQHTWFSLYEPLLLFVVV